MRIYIILIFILLINEVRAQPQLELGGGWKMGKLVDQSFSPLTYNNSSYDMELGFSYTFAGKSKIEANLLGGIGTDFNKHFKNSNYNIGIAASYSHKVWSRSENFSVWVGGKYSYCGNASIYDMSATSFIFTHDFALQLCTEWRYSKHSIQTEVTPTLFGLVTRLPYNNYSTPDNVLYSDFYYAVRILSDVDFATFGEYFSLVVGLEYYYELTKRLDIGGKYSLSYTYCSFPEPISMSRNRFLLKLRYRV